MAIHLNLQSMLYESLPEMLLTAKYCIEFQKDINIWSAPGCYGYPAALLLLSIADSIGSYVEGGNVENHFKILINKDYYGLTLTDQQIKLIYEYRNLLSHHTVMAIDVGLKIGLPGDLVLENQNGEYWLNLVPLYNVSVKAVNALLSDPQILKNNRTISNICKKSS